jgi:hypothetical protein
MTTKIVLDAKQSAVIVRPPLPIVKSHRSSKHPSQQQRRRRRRRQQQQQQQEEEEEEEEEEEACSCVGVCCRAWRCSGELVWSYEMIRCRSIDKAPDRARVKHSGDNLSP